MEWCIQQPGAFGYGSLVLILVLAFWAVLNLLLRHRPTTVESAFVGVGVFREGMVHQDPPPTCGERPLCVAGLVLTLLSIAGVSLFLLSCPLSLEIDPFIRPISTSWSYSIDASFSSRRLPPPTLCQQSLGYISGRVHCLCRDTDRSDSLAH